MIKISNKLKLYLYAALTLTAVAVILCAICYAAVFDADPGYFDESSPLTYALVAFCILSVLAFFSSIFTLPKNALDGASPTTFTVNIASIPAAVCSALLGGFMVSAYFLISTQNIFGKIFPDYTANNAILLLVGGIFLLFSAAYYVFLWFDHGDRSEIAALIGFSVPVAALLLIVLTYFDMHSPMNCPAKLSFQLSMLSFMLFSLYELRIHLQKPRPRLYFMFAMTTMLTTGISSFPVILAYCTGKIESLSYMLYAVFALCVFIYVTSRVCVFVSARELLEKISDQTPTDEPEEETEK